MKEKSIKDLSLDITEEEYRAMPALSYSTLSRFEREGWRKLPNLFDKIEGPFLTFGSAVDTYLTDGVDAFNEQFVVCEYPAISDTLVAITKSLYIQFGPTVLTLDGISDEDISNTALMNNYYVKPNYANHRVKSIRENCGIYYELLRISEGKIILTQQDYDDIIACVEELRTNKRTARFFNGVSPWEDNFEKLFQLKFEAEFEGISVRCMFDEIIVDHKDKKIFPIDLKTTGKPEEEFMDSFLHWRYDIQGKLYSYILQEVISKDEYFKDFTIEAYQFIVINRRTLSPLVYIFQDNFSDKNLVTHEGKVYRDWRPILQDLNYYLNAGTVKYSREDADTRFKLINNYTINE